MKIKEFKLENAQCIETKLNIETGKINEKIHAKQSRKNHTHEETDGNP